MTAHLDDPPVDVPPPPYSETDIYSDSAGRSPPALGQSQALPIRQRAASHNSLSAVPANDDASSAASNSEVVYTPPLTPHSSHSVVPPFRSPNLLAGGGSSNNNNNGGFLRASVPNDQQQQHASVASSSDHLTSASAEAYFESRPVAAGVVESSREVVRHGITIRPGSSPADFAYRPEWMQRDVRPDDWQTFLNYLLPNHVAESNEVLIDRKLRAEGIEEAAAAPRSGEKKEGPIAGEGDASPVVAQLEQIRLEAQPGQSLDETIREWNDGFFGPRGMTINIEVPSSTLRGDARMPGSWDQSFFGGIPSPGPSPSRQARSGGDGGSSSWWRSLPRFETSSRGLRFGGMSIDNDRISIGDSFCADSRGVRIGSLVADDNGMRLHGRDLFGGTGPEAHPPPPAAAAAAAAAVPPTRFRSPPPMPPSYAHGFEHHNHIDTCDAKTRGANHRHRQHHYGERRGGGRRGRHRHGQPTRHRSSSTASSSSSSSSASSSSSSSSSSTISSIGSLPDYDDLKDSQIPVVHAYLKDWLSHPEHVISRAAVKEAREDIKAAKKKQKQHQKQQKHREEEEEKEEESNKKDTTTTTNNSRLAERQEVRAMLGQWERVKREQKTTRRQLRRERKAKRRAERRARRETRREMRRARRASRREGREARREAAGRKAEEEEEEEEEEEKRRGGPRHRRGGGRRGGGRGGGVGGGLQEDHGSGPGSYGPFYGGGGYQGFFPGAGYGPGAQRHGGAFYPFGGAGGRGGAYQPGRAGAAPPRGPPWPFPVGPMDMPTDETGAHRPRPRDASVSARGTDELARRFPGIWPGRNDGSGGGGGGDTTAASRSLFDEEEDGEGHDGAIGQETGVAEGGDSNVEGPYAVSAGMYRELEAKRAALREKRTALSVFAAAAEEQEQEQEEEEGKKKSGLVEDGEKRPGASTLEGLLVEMEELEQAIDRLALAADEQYARELMMYEESRTYPDLGV